MLPDLEFPPRVETAIRAGDLRFAKETLRSYLRTGPFDPATCEQLGAVLLELGEGLEAGRMLWLSGSERPEYRDVIQHFLARLEGSPWHSFIAQFPKSARREPIERLPPRVLATLRERGYPEGPEFATLAGAQACGGVTGPPSNDRWTCAIFSTLAGVIVLLVALGVFQLVQIVISWF
jgi:hypothetical protein